MLSSGVQGKHLTPIMCDPNHTLEKIPHNQSYVLMTNFNKFIYKPVHLIIKPYVECVLKFTHSGFVLKEKENTYHCHENNETASLHLIHWSPF